MDTTTQVVVRPYWISYFLPDRIERRPTQVLVDTGCTSNLLSKTIFDRPLAQTNNSLEVGQSHGVLADGSLVLFYSINRWDQIHRIREESCPVWEVAN